VQYIYTIKFKRILGGRLRCASASSSLSVYWHNAVLYTAADN